MHAQQLSRHIDTYERDSTPEQCRQLFQYIRRHSLDAHFPVWFRCSQLAKEHQLHDLYVRTFQLPVCTIDEYRLLADLLLRKGCTLPCIHQIYMYMFQPDARVDKALRTIVSPGS